jgi:DNA modification methylase
MGKQKAFDELVESNFTSKCDLITGDALEELDGYENGKFDLTITSPPYNLGKEYETRKSIHQYLKTQEKIIDEIVRVTSDQGSICWQVGNFVKDGEIFPLDSYYYDIFKDAGLKLRNRIIWHFGHGLHASNRFSGRYETILWFSKTDDYIFNLDPVRVPSKYPGKDIIKDLKNENFQAILKGKILRIFGKF